MKIKVKRELELWYALLRILPGEEIVYNGYFSWLVSGTTGPLQLDFFMPNLKIGVEIMGIQHYKFTPWIHKNMANFRALKQRDKIKAAILKEKGIALIIFDYKDKLTEANIRDKLQEAGIEY